MTRDGLSLSKFGDCSSAVARFGLSCGQTDTHRDAAKRFTPATVVGESNNKISSIKVS